LRKHEKLSVRRQCELFGLARSTAYYQPQEIPDADLAMMRLLDEEYLRHPFKGSRKMREWLLDQGLDVNRKRVQRLMRLMGICGLNPRRSTSKPHPAHKKYGCRSVTDVESACCTSVGNCGGTRVLRGAWPTST